MNDKTEKLRGGNRAAPKDSAPNDHAKPAQAAALIAIGASKRANLEATELAAWTVVASTILNLDQTVTKE